MSKAKTSLAPSAEDIRDPRLFLQLIDRTMKVMESFSGRARPLSLAEIAGAAGIDKSAAQRICYTLQELGYLERDELARGLRPGLRWLDRSFDFLRMHPLVERAVPVLIELRRVAKERVDLSLLDDLSIIYAVRLQFRRESFFATLVGRRLPTYCSSGGRAMMALMEDADVTSILERSERRQLTPKTVTGIDEIRALVEQARRDHYAFAQEEWMMGEVVLAAAIRDAAGRPVAAIHIAGSLSDWDAEAFQQKVAPMAIEAARSLSG
jgi:DNA-binding IclR family transcriptional regulator